MFLIRILNVLSYDKRGREWNILKLWEVIFSVTVSFYMLWIRKETCYIQQQTIKGRYMVIQQREQCFDTLSVYREMTCRSTTWQDVSYDSSTITPLHSNGHSGCASVFRLVLSHIQGNLIRVPFMTIYSENNSNILTP